MKIGDKAETSTRACGALQKLVGRYIGTVVAINGPAVTVEFPFIGRVGGWRHEWKKARS